MLSHSPTSRKGTSFPRSGWERGSSRTDNIIFSFSPHTLQAHEGGMDIQQRFLRSIAILAVVAFVLFSLEFLWEWNRLGQPDEGKRSYAGVNQNNKLVDV